MGTNYYTVPKKPTLYPHHLHIGKSSAGWKFLFQGYQGYELEYEKYININSVEDWKQYLKENDILIFDEYDQEVSYDDFFKMVEEKQSEENVDNFSNCANINGYRFSYNDFS